ncbi:MAG: hypothetical protein HY831_01840 [Candidatus Aenigmarchaeota archaeon]|nr:hypothetical protein [Candidatus Aenigmarchaeota archaeon]
MLEFSKDNTNREKHPIYEQPLPNSDLDNLNYVVNKVFNVLSSGYLQLYQVVDPEFCGLEYQSISLYIAESIDQAKSYVQNHLSGVDLYTQSQIEESLKTIKPFDLSIQSVINLDFFLDLYYVIFDNDSPAYVGQINF